MKVSFDELRKKLLRNYNSLTKKLNNNISDSEITIDVDNIQQEMENIKDCIVTLSFMYDDREYGFFELENPEFEVFNDIEEDN